MDDRDGHWFRLLMDTDDDHATIVLDGHGRIVTWSERAERLQGRGEAEVIGRPAAFLAAAEGGAEQAIDDLLDLARDCGHVTRTGWATTADGRRLAADLVITALPGPRAA